MTDRAKIANVRSILDSTAQKSDRRARKAGTIANTSASAGATAAEADAARSRPTPVPVQNDRSMVPHRERASVYSGHGRDLLSVDDALSLAERERHELARMEEARLFSDRQLDQLGIVHPRSNNREMVDAIRQLRTKLFGLRKNGNFSVLVSSVVPQGGGSFVALNLAAAIAFDQTKTSLMVDANLHDPVLHKLLKLIGRDGARGLIDYLETPDIGIEAIVNPSGIPRMRIIPSGNAVDKHADEHLSSQRCQKLMIDIKERYGNRYVIVDGPPMATSADARILAEMCDYIVLVVPYGSVTPGTLDSIIDEIDETKLAGIVLNDQPA